MKPLPAQKIAGTRTPQEDMPSLPTGLSAASGSFSKTNRRTASSPVQRAYPWLLMASTIMAGTFCLLYITKPVIVAAGNKETTAAKPETRSAPASNPANTKSVSLLPDKDRLPGDSNNPAATNTSPANPRRSILPPSHATNFEETNLRIQHILTAEAPGGHVDRIDLEVPVLYQSRSLRWTPDEVAQARDLLARLMDYQEKSQSMRAEGMQLLDAWNRLIGNSLPAHDLRADSPSLPANQVDTAESPRLADSLSNGSIQIQPSGK